MLKFAQIGSRIVCSSYTPYEGGKFFASVMELMFLSITLHSSPHWWPWLNPVSHTAETHDSGRGLLMRRRLLGRKGDKRRWGTECEQNALYACMELQNNKLINT